MPNLCGIDSAEIEAIINSKTAKNPAASNTSKSESTTETSPLTQVPTTHLMAPKEKNYSMKQEFFEAYKKIGEGSFGKVFSALHKPSGTVMALKGLSMNLESDDEYDMLISEFDVMQKLTNCRYSITLYGAFIVNQYIYFAMDMCSEGTVFDYIQQNTLPLKTIK